MACFCETFLASGPMGGVEMEAPTCNKYLDRVQSVQIHTLPTTNWLKGETSEY